MRVLVTGSEGYIGSVLMRYLLEAGYEVTGLDACYLSNRRFVGSLPEYELIKSDIRDIGVSQLEGFYAICHLAALSNDPAGELQPEITEDINYRGTVSLARKAKKAGVERFIFSGSCSIYGISDDPRHLTEEARFNPVTPYALSKVLAEKDLSQLADEGFSPVFLRNATAFGVSPRLRLDVVVNNLSALAFTTGKIAMTSDGTPWRPLVHVEDISLAFKCALETERSIVHNQAFNVGITDANYQVREVAESIGDVLPDAEITFGRRAEGDLDERSYKVSFEKARAILKGFEPKWQLRDGIEELLRSYRSFPLEERHLHGDEFITLNRYINLLEEGAIGSDFRWKAGSLP